MAVILAYLHLDTSGGNVDPLFTKTHPQSPFDRDPHTFACSNPNYDGIMGPMVDEREFSHHTQMRMCEGFEPSHGKGEVAVRSHVEDE